MVRFENFELDMRTGELRRNGTRVRLQEQPFQILALLLERAGEVVTREELQRKLWSADTFVDFDNGLNIAVKKLRPRWATMQKLHGTSKLPSTRLPLPGAGDRRRCRT